MITLSIGQYTALDVSPEEHIDIASESGCQMVSLLVNAPSPQATLPLVTHKNLSRVKNALDSSGIRVLNIEWFIIGPDTDVEHFLPALELGTELQASGATVIIYDSDQPRVAKNLQQLSALARDSGLRINIEFLAMTPKWNTLQSAAELVRYVDAPNLGLCIDILHLIRSGGSPADIAMINPDFIHYVQLCDGDNLATSQDYGEEAVGNRLAPGDGHFPIVPFLQAIPAGTPVEIEVPQPPGRPARERVTNIVNATRRQLELAALC